MYLSEVQSTGDRVTKPSNLQMTKAEAGPLSPLAVPLMDGLDAKLANWKVEAGEASEKKTLLLAQNHGDNYLLSSKRTLPGSFQVNIPCIVAPLTAAGGSYATRNELVVRFATDDASVQLAADQGV